MKYLLFILYVFVVISANGQNKIKFQYKGDNIIMGNEYLMDRQDTFNMADLPNPQPLSKFQIKNVTPLTERFWRMAFSVLEKNMLKTDSGKIIASSISNVGLVGLMGLNELLPRQMKWSLMYSVDSYLNGEVEVRSDIDILWIWSTVDLFQKNPELADWKWLYTQAEKAFKLYYDLQFDKDEGLYWGKDSFLKLSFNDHIKSTSVNCLYYKSIEAMETIADSLQFYEKSLEWSSRKENLKVSIRKNLRNSDTTFAAYRMANGLLSNSTDVFGSSLIMLSGIASPVETACFIWAYPRTDMGMPLMVENIDSITNVNTQTSTPITDVFFCKAIESCTGADLTAFNASVLIRNSTKYKKYIDTTYSKDSDEVHTVFNTFYEALNIENGISIGDPDQLMSAVAFINVCMRAKLISVQKN